MINARIPKEVPLTLLLTVFKGGKLTMTEIQKKTNFSTITVLDHINALIEVGLLEEEREGGFPKRRIIKTTKEGARVASLINLADTTNYEVTDFIEMGAKAGRMAAYQETLTSLKNMSASREYLIAELLLKGIGVLTSGLANVARGLPSSLKEKGDLLMQGASKLEAQYEEGQKKLAKGDIRGSTIEVSKALSEFSSMSKLMKEVVDALKEQKCEELADFVDYLNPKTTQKE
uniref:Uncharacterized protein n=1 Tax=Candidatus Methanomethylicus mesodigestus TaxID=1867258 RepID=A0A7C3EX62_9CREN